MSGQRKSNPQELKKLRQPVRYFKIELLGKIEVQKTTYKNDPGAYTR